MIYNNVTNTLRNWCNEMTQRYSDDYQQERSRTGQRVRFLSYLVTAELSYKLGTIIDKEYRSFEEYRKAVLELIPLHIDFTLKKELGKIEPITSRPLYLHSVNIWNPFLRIVYHPLCPIIE